MYLKIGLALLEVPMKETDTQSRQRYCLIKVVRSVAKMLIPRVGECNHDPSSLVWPEFWAHRAHERLSPIHHILHYIT